MRLRNGRGNAPPILLIQASSGSGGLKEGNTLADDILVMKNITKLYPGVRALSNVNLNVHRGEIHALVGENGAGKSTLMNVLSGTIPHGQ